VVDKAPQVLFVVQRGVVEWTLNTSTGTEQPYLIDDRPELADTPPGQWKVTSVYDGVDVGELGALYRPRYFHPDGIAVHGYSDVPAYRASHGCVRVSNAAIDWIWAENIMPIGSPVWVY
jgi:lipoprotein-anchoring transpeptidase ErfK/SrfK